jgi:hypothetical protein
MKVSHRLRGPLTLLLLLLAIPFLQACESGAAWEGTVIDSAGISIVMNTDRPLWTDETAWTLEEDLRIGTVAGDVNYQFGNILFGVDADASGNIYVLDMQAQDIRVYDPEGTYVRTIGGPGSGPGEIGQQGIFLFVDQNGEVVLPDLGNVRVQRYSPEGEVLGSFRIEIAGGAPARWDLGPNGEIMAQLRGLNVEGIATLEEGDPIVIYDSTGAVSDTLAMLPKGEMTAGISEESFSMMIFAPEPVWDLSPTGYLYGARNSEYRVHVTSPDGVLTRIIARDVGRKPVSDPEKDAIFRVMRQQMQDLGVPQAQLEQIVQGVGIADEYPAFGQLFCGPDETLWVQRILAASDMSEEDAAEFDPQNLGSRDWEVFDSEGRYMGVVAMPDRFRPVTSKGGMIYGVWADELDVQHVMRLRINMPEA